MKFALETVFIRSIGHVGVISGIAATHHGTRSQCNYTGSQAPLYVLLKTPEGKGIEGFGTGGISVPIEEIEMRCPGCVYRFSQEALSACVM
ncbi:MAG: hypothetical protein ACI9IV_001850 [Paracoccaceae bacterium]|jgi:hypothetical protein|tara:strand:+ start:258 stop:530 length:273 start_codon:yes stop_codon:yes gene_type:complete